MENSFSVVEKLYFWDWDKFEKLFTKNIAYKYLTFFESILLVLTSIKKSYAYLCDSKNEEIFHVESQDDPKIWRSKEYYRYEYDHIFHALNILGNNQTQMDISRRIKSNTIRDGLFTIEILEETIKRHVLVPEIIFVKDLRNYIQHYSIPSIFWQYCNRFDGSGIDHQLVIETAPLLTNSNNSFTSPSKKFLRKAEYINIDHVFAILIDNYFSLYSEIFSSVFKKIEINIYDYLFTIECKEQIVKKLRNEIFFSSDEDIRGLSEGKLEAFYKKIESINSTDITLLYEVNCLIHNLRV